MTTAGLVDVAAQVSAWRAQGREVVLARVVAASGLAGREAAPVAAWPADGGAGVGSPLAQLARSVRPGSGGRTVEVSLTDADADGAGLACGGRATVLVQSATELPDAFWDAVGRGDPVGLVDTSPAEAGDTAAPTRWFGPDDVPARFARFFGRGVSGTVEMARETAGEVVGEVVSEVVTTYWPRPRLVVVGGGPVAAALTAQASLLGWEIRVLTDTTTDTESDPATDAGAVVTGLGRADAVVVLSHDRAVDGPVLAAAVRSAVGYVGAMGSRHTQAARAEWFAAHGVTEGLERIHGPAGLDIGGFGPAEIALSITAEIVAVRSRRGS